MVRWCCRFYMQVIQLLPVSPSGTHTMMQDAQTSLHYAASLGNKDVVVLLLNFGAAIEAKDNVSCLQCAGVAFLACTE